MARAAGSKWWYTHRSSVSAAARNHGRGCARLVDRQPAFIDRNLRRVLRVQRAVIHVAVRELLGPPVHVDISAGDSLVGREYDTEAVVPGLPAIGVSDRAGRERNVGEGSCGVGHVW